MLSPCTTNCPVSFCLLLSLSPSFLKKMKILCLSLPVCSLLPQKKEKKKRGDNLIRLPVCLCLSPSLPSETEYAIYIFIFQQNLYTDFVRDHLSGKTPPFIIPAAPLLAGFDVRVFFFFQCMLNLSVKRHYVIGSFWLLTVYEGPYEGPATPSDKMFDNSVSGGGGGGGGGFHHSNSSSNVQVINNTVTDSRDYSDSDSDDIPTLEAGERGCVVKRKCVKGQ